MGVGFGVVLFSIIISINTDNDGWLLLVPVGWIFFFLFRLHCLFRNAARVREQMHCVNQPFLSAVNAGHKRRGWPRTCRVMTRSRSVLFSLSLSHFFFVYNFFFK